MKSKNISVNIKENQEIPFKETYIAIYNSNSKVIIHQKFNDSKHNQKIELNFKECERLMNLFYYYVFKGDYKYSKDKAIIYQE